MRTRILLVAAIAVVAVSQSMAAGLFSSRKSGKRSQTRYNKIPQSVLKSPEKMTEVFGPSVLVRDAAEEAKPARKFVTQPE